MKRRNWQQSWMFAMIAVAGLASAASVWGDKLFFHHGKRSNACGVRDYEYDFTAGGVTTRAIAIAPVDQPQHVATGAAPDPLAAPGESLRKAFFVDRTSFEADHVLLSRVSLAIYNDGRYVGTGLLSFDGGPDGAFHGANVLIRVRAYAGTPQAPVSSLKKGTGTTTDNGQGRSVVEPVPFFRMRTGVTTDNGLLPGQVPPVVEPVPFASSPSGDLDHMRLLWHTRQLVWIGRQQTKAISLFPEPPRTHPIPLEQATPTVLNGSSQTPSSLICEHFHEITHFEIIVERQKDR